jgi:hypothetical protein
MPVRISVRNAQGQDLASTDSGALEVRSIRDASSRKHWLTGAFTVIG